MLSSFARSASVKSSSSSTHSLASLSYCISSEVRSGNIGCYWCTASSILSCLWPGRPLSLSLVFMRSRSSPVSLSWLKCDSTLCASSTLGRMVNKSSLASDFFAPWKRSSMLSSISCLSAFNCKSSLRIPGRSPVRYSTYPFCSY